jgi:hypothetical protein
MRPTGSRAPESSCNSDFGFDQSSCLFFDHAGHFLAGTAPAFREAMQAEECTPMSVIESCMSPF